VVNSVQKAILVLRRLGNRENLSLSEISRDLGIPKSSTHSILSTLESNGLIERDSTTQRYHLGTTLIELGHQAQHELTIYRVAHPHLEELNRQVDETVHLTILDADEVLYIDCVESKKRLRTYSVIGVRAPLHCTSVGKVIMAYLPEEEQDRIIAARGLPRFTRNTITNEKALKGELRRIREMGYAVDNDEHEDHLRCIGAPIHNHRGEVYASLSLSGPSQRVTSTRVAELAAYVTDAAQAISHRLGFAAARRA